MLFRMRCLILVVGFFPSLISFAHIHEDELGLEDSQDLREAVAQLLRPDGSLSLKELGLFENEIQNKRDELYKLLVDTEKAGGMSQDEAEDEALGQKQIFVLEFILDRLEDLKHEADPIQRFALAKQILRLSSTFSADGAPPSIQLAFEIGRVAFLESHNVALDERKTGPAANLVNPAHQQYFSKDELRQKIERHEDISVYDPPNSSFWAKPASIAQQSVLKPMEINSAVPQTFTYKKVIKSDHHPKIKTFSRSPSGKKIEWKMKFGREVETEYFATRWMELMGFNSDESYFVSNAKVYFENEDEFKSMVREWVKFYPKELDTPSNFIVEEGSDSDGFFVVFHKTLIEARPKDTERVGPMHLTLLGNHERREVRAQLLLQAFINNTDIKESHNNKTKMVKDSQGRWHVQELIHDLGKSFGSLLVSNFPNGFSWNFLKTSRGKLRIDYRRYHYISRDKNPFMQASYSDLKWAARLLVQVTPEQIRTLINNSGWPEPVGHLYFEKLTTRRNEVVREFHLEGEYLDGQKVNLWPEVKPKEFNFGAAVIEGELFKDYKSHPQDINYANAVGVNFDFNGVLLRLLVNSASMGIEKAPLERIFTLRDDHGSFVLKNYLGGMHVVIHREITRNENTNDDSKLWVVKDRLDVGLAVGLGVDIPVGPGGFDLKARSIVGKRYTLTHYTGQLVGAAKSKFNRVFRLPFQPQEVIEALSPGEEVTDGFFISLKLQEEFELGNTWTAAVGPGLGQETRFLVHTGVKNLDNGKIEVAHQKSNELEGEFYVFAQFFKILKLEFFRASMMLGQSKGQAYTFDFSTPPSIDTQRAYNRLVYNHKDDLAEQYKIPFATMRSNFKGKGWWFGVLAGLGSQYHGTYALRTDPDHTMHRTFEYKIEKERENPLFLRRRAYRVLTSLDFGDNSFTDLTRSSLVLMMEWENEKTASSYMKRMLEKVNATVGDTSFVEFTPERWAEKHLGNTYTIFQVRLKDDAIACLLEAIGCAQESEGHLMKWDLTHIRKAHDPATRYKRLSRWLAHMFTRPQNWEKVRTYVGDEKFAKELFVQGEFLPTGKPIHVLKL
ncbi:MAG: hypothetical protein HYW48_02090 [Deltaproteobacteria bacterium]|nr:hypothetical protein [Deltaproteobacteria bacterium]